MTGKKMSMEEGWQAQGCIEKAKTEERGDRKQIPSARRITRLQIQGEGADADGKKLNNEKHVGCRWSTRRPRHQEHGGGRRSGKQQGGGRGAAELSGSSGRGGAKPGMPGRWKSDEMVRASASPKDKGMETGMRVRWNPKGEKHARRSERGLMEAQKERRLERRPIKQQCGTMPRPNKRLKWTSQCRLSNCRKSIYTC